MSDGVTLRYVTLREERSVLKRLWFILRKNYSVTKDMQLLVTVAITAGVVKPVENLPVAYAVVAPELG